MGGTLSQLVYLTPHPKLWSTDCVQILKMTFKCYISENYENTLKFGHFLYVYNNQSLEMPWMTGGGQPIPAGLSYPPPMILEHWLAIDFVIAVNCFNKYKRICFTNTDTACLYKKFHFKKFFIYRWGETYPSWFTLPPTPFLPHHHPGHCSSKFLQIMEWVFSASWVKLMKISYYRNIFCLFTTTSHYQCL